MAAPPIVVAVVIRDDHVVEDGPQLVSREPEQHRRGGQSLFHIKVVMMQGDTAMAIGRAREELVRKVAVQLLRGLSPTCGLAQDL